MKRYLLFQYAGYYPSGGWNDFNGDFDTIGEARIKARATKDDEPMLGQLWHVIDTTTMNKVAHDDDSIEQSLNPET